MDGAARANAGGSGGANTGGSGGSDAVSSKGCGKTPTLQSKSTININSAGLDRKYILWLLHALAHEIGHASGETGQAKGCGRHRKATPQRAPPYGRSVTRLSPPRQQELFPDS